MTWPTAKLGELFQIARGGSPRPISDYITDDPDGVNWISIKDASGSSKFITKTEKKIKQAGVARSREVKPGDFLLTNSMSFGRPYILETSGCIHDGWLVLRGEAAVVDQDFFYHLLGSDFIYRKFQAVAAGAVVKNLNIDLVSQVEVPLPPLPEQRRIAAILDKADALRAKRREAIAKLDQLMQSVFLDMFGDPVTNPKGHPVRKLGSVLARKTCAGAYFPKGKYVQQGGVPMVHMGDAFYGVVRRETLKRVDASSKEIQKYALSPDDILVSRRSLNYEGSAKPCRVESIGEPLIFESSIIRVTPNPEIVIPTYLYYFLSNERARKKFVFKHVTRSTISGINQNGLNKVELPVPPLELQHRFSKVDCQCSELIGEFEKQLSRIEYLVGSAQQRAFSGAL